MTPEQKAFYEYGKARGILKEVRFQMISMEYDEKRYHKLSKAICDAWQKRAACRIERHCGNCGRCNHEGDMWGEVNSFCTLPTRACLCVTDVPDDFCCNYWEPRKEGE